MLTSSKIYSLFLKTNDDMRFIKQNLVVVEWTDRR